MGNKRTKKSISLEGFVFLAIFLGIFGGMGMKMGNGKKQKRKTTGIFL